MVAGSPKHALVAGGRRPPVDRTHVRGLLVVWTPPQIELTRSSRPKKPASDQDIHRVGDEGVEPSASAV